MRFDLLPYIVVCAHSATGIWTKHAHSATSVLNEILAPVRISLIDGCRYIRLMSLYLSFGCCCTFLSCCTLLYFSARYLHCLLSRCVSPLFILKADIFQQVSLSFCFQHRKRTSSRFRSVSLQSNSSSSKQLHH